MENTTANETRQDVMNAYYQRCKGVLGAESQRILLQEGYFERYEAAVLREIANQEGKGSE